MFKKWCKKHTRIIQKALAFIIAFCILALCVLISFIVPPIKASAADAAYESYLQSLPGVIASAPLSPSDGVQLGLQLGLQQAYETMIETGDMRSAGTVVTFTGKYYHNSDPHIAYAYNYSNYSAVSGGVDLCTSDEFSVRAIMTPVSAFQFLSFSGLSGNPKSGLSFGGRSRGGNITTTITDSGGSSIFPSNYENTTYYSYDTWCNCHSTFSSTTIPVLSDNSALNSYFVGDVSSGNVIAGWQNYSPMKYISDIPGANDFTFTSDNYMDFILEVYNPWIEEEYPDLVVYLYNPVQDPTEETGGGCGCHVEVNVEPTVNVEVNVEPTVNVYVENEIELPSEWVETYPFETLPSENVEFPTESPSYALPTDPIEALPPGAKDGIHFWVALWGALLVSSGLIVYVPVFLVLSIIEWLLWHAGSSKSGKGGH